jgi:hypothetical protein
MEKQKYLVTEYKKTLTQKKAMLEEIGKMKPVDLQVNEPKGEIIFRSEDGKINTISGLGFYLWQLLINILWAMGDLIKLDSINFVNARVCRLRSKFKDSNSYFFKTQKNPIYGICLNPDRSWRFIERLPEKK